jgi:hypothetical protein
METQYDNLNNNKISPTSTNLNNNKKLPNFNKTTHPNSSKQTETLSTTVLPQSTGRHQEMN